MIFLKTIVCFLKQVQILAIDRFKSAGKRVKKYMEDPHIGVEAVEKNIRCLSILLDFRFLELLG